MYEYILLLSKYFWPVSVQKVLNPSILLKLDCCMFVCLFVCPDCIKVMGEKKPHLYLRYKLNSKCYYR